MHRQGDLSRCDSAVQQQLGMHKSVAFPLIVVALLLLTAVLWPACHDAFLRYRPSRWAATRNDQSLRKADDPYSELLALNASSPLPRKPSAAAYAAAGKARRVLVSFDWPNARLGNKMFQYASTLGVALFHGLPLVVMQDASAKAEGFGQMKRLFRLASDDDVKTSDDAAVLGGAQQIIEPGWGLYNPAVEVASTFTRPDVTLMGYVQSWKYFARSMTAIKQHYALTREYSLAADAFFRQVVPTVPPAASSTVLVGVHVRRGDMLAYPSLYTAAPASYLAVAMKYYMDKFEPNATVFFVVATDDWPWVQAMLHEHRIAAERVVQTQATAELDFAVLSRCNHSIITGGTFGWWSAFLAGGEVVYFKDFVSKFSALYSTYREEDYYLPNWIGLT